ncbi:MAG: AraC family transcriptional regulator [Phaeodactylibacter sp.]|nr:AraC family transcriptional regulator [Phaeodactylibacter sp.]
METATPSLDTWASFFILAAAHGYFLAAILFFNRQGNHVANRLLGAFLLAFALTLSEYVLHWTKYITWFPWADSWYIPLIFVFGPLAFLYFKALNPEDELRRRDALHFVPALLALINRLPYYLTDPAVKAAFRAGNQEMAEQIHWPFFPMFGFQDFLFILHLSAYAVLAYWYLRRNGFWRLSGEADDSALIRRNWSRTLLGLYMGFVLGNASYYILIRTPFFHIEWDYGISLAMTVAIYMVGYLGYRQPEIFAGELWPKAFLAPKYQNSSLTPSASRSLLGRVLEYVEREKPYLDNELRLSGLAEQLDISVHHLSQVLNEQLGKSFSDFINEYRVEHARRLLADPRYKGRYVIAIAYESGFNNKTSFNKAFKAHTGMSPSQYRKKKLAKVSAESRSDG